MFLLLPYLLKLKIRKKQKKKKNIFVRYIIAVETGDTHLFNPVSVSSMEAPPATEQLWTEVILPLSPW